MIEFLRSWVLNIVTLAIFIVLIEMLIPSGKIKKFVNLVSGFILLIAIVNPLITLFDRGVNLKDFTVESSNFINRKEIEASSKVLKDSQIKQITETYRKKIIKQMEESALEIKDVADAKADAIINEDYKSERFGEIKRAYLSLQLKNAMKDAKTVTKIEKIRVDGGGDGKEQTSKTQVDRALEKQLQEKISKLFGLHANDIIISLQ